MFFFGKLVIIWWLVEAFILNLPYPIPKNGIFVERKKNDFVKVLDLKMIFAF
jgi:hypothetical protein